MKIKYLKYNPSGNITALVIGDKYNKNERKIINDYIMKEDKEIEQVGFLSEDKNKMSMAGEEFCGNATRCAAMYYLKNKELDKIIIETCNMNLQAGIDKDNKIWCEIPIDNYKIEIIDKDKEIYMIKLKGITIISIKNKTNFEAFFLKNKAENIIKKYNLDDKAVGIMFINKTKDIFKMYPVVWVKKVNTLFLENACGSGSIAVTLLESVLSNKINKYKVIQPSNIPLETEIVLENKKVVKAILKGKILKEGEETLKIEI